MDSKDCIVIMVSSGLSSIIISIIDPIIYKENSVNLFIAGLFLLGIGIIDNINRKNNIYDSRLSKLSTLFLVLVMSLILINILILIK